MRATIDGRAFETEGRTTVLQAARALGLAVPSLCDHPRLRPYAGCRLCLVEIAGRPGLAPACATPLEDGMRVITDSDRVRAARREVLALILSEHPHACLVCAEKSSCDEAKATIRKTGEVTGCVLCPRNGRCELQAVVEAVGLKTVSHPAVFRGADVRRDDPFIDRDGNLCILCGRCVRVCAELRGASVLTIVARGPAAAVGTAFDRRLFDSGCLFCGACVDACPTGALAERAVRYDRGPVERTRSICALCGQGCFLDVERRGGRPVSASPADVPPNRGQACVKGRFLTAETAGHPLRILAPRLRRGGALVEAGWEEALDAAAEALAEAGAPETAFRLSGCDACEDARAAVDLARGLGVADIRAAEPSPAAAVAAWARSLGLPLRSNRPFAPPAETKAFLVFDDDLPVTQPILWLELHQAIGSGARMFLVASRETALSRCAAATVTAAPGREIDVLLLLGRLILESERREDVAAVPGFDALQAALKEVSIPDLLASCGLHEEKARKLAHSLARRKASLLVGRALAGGAEEPRNLAAAWNLALLTGGALIPLAFEANARGLEALLRDHPSVRRSAPAKTVYLAGSGLGYTRTTETRLIVQDAYWSPAAEAADVVLPQAVFLETGGTLVNAEGRINRAEAALEPAGESRPGAAICDALASRLFKKPAHRHGREKADINPPAAAAGSFPAEAAAGVRRFVPVPRESPAEKAGREGAAPVADGYKGLHLARDIKSLKILRERTWPRS